MSAAKWRSIAENFPEVDEVEFINKDLMEAGPSRAVPEYHGSKEVTPAKDKSKHREHRPDENLIAPGIGANRLSKRPEFCERTSVKSK
jgi:hypothetical protein